MATVPTDTLPWYKSKIIMGAVVSIITKILVATGVLGGAVDDVAITNALLLVIGGAADLWIMYHRTTQKRAPAISAS